MTEPLTVLIVAHAFHPSAEIGARRVTALARYLVGQGIRVVVVSQFGGAPLPEGSEVLPGVVAIPVKQPRRVLLDTLVSLKGVVRSGQPAEPSRPADPGAIKGTRSQPVGLARKLAEGIREAIFSCAFVLDEQKRWSWRASRAAVRAGRQYHAGLVLSSGPPFTPVTAAWWAARRLGVPHVADLRDPWSDVEPVSRVHPRGVRLRARALFERIVLRSAAAVTCTTEVLAGILQARHPVLRRSLHLIRNGYDGSVSRVPAETGGRLSMLFAGELYLQRDPFPILSALENLLARADVDSSRVSLTFLGKCETFNGTPLREWLAGKRCERVVRVVPPVAPDDVREYVAASTVLLNLSQGQPMSIPAKTYEHLASGREPLVVCEPESETARVAAMNGVIQVDGTDARALDAALLDLYQRHVRVGRLTAPREADVVRYSRRAANEAFLALIQALTGQGERRLAAREAGGLGRESGGEHAEGRHRAFHPVDEGIDLIVPCRRSRQT